MSLREVNQEEFAQVVASGFSMVDVYGDGCAPCKVLARIIEQMDAEYPFVNFVKINSSHNQEFANRFRIAGVPTILMMVDGEEKERLHGAHPADNLMEVISKYIY
jgi:thioredoxin 1